MESTEWSLLPDAEKKRQLYLHQKDVLDKFLERGAISRQQYEKSLNDMTAKMGMEKELNQLEIKNDS